MIAGNLMAITVGSGLIARTASDGGMLPVAVSG
ncbi:Uncharacterised protein [Amycolatopsis camponoti]|uniref:Uncharacterized protein n=1 Tax=Amycolatopsis camponoti TaxID=2606593 RepID=A0A6I8LQU4_9PSEU|nr:Uncharacterised protein [Amycolatopsis camponoti]